MTGHDSALASRGTDPAPAAGATGTPSMADLISGILGDTQKLGRQQIDMLKAEFKEDLARTKRAIVYGALGVVLLSVGGIALVFCLVEVLHEQAGFKMWSSALIVGGAMLAAGVVLGLMARNLFESFNPLPDKTFNALQENVSWKTHPQA